MAAATCKSCWSPTPSWSLWGGTSAASTVIVHDASSDGVAHRQCAGLCIWRWHASVLLHQVVACPARWRQARRGDRVSQTSCRRADMIYNEARLQRSEVCCEADTSAHTVVEPTKEVIGSGLASGLQLQRAAHAEFPNVVRLFELDWCAILLRTAGGGGIFAVLAGAVAVLDFGTQESEVEVPLTEGHRVLVFEECCDANSPAHCCHPLLWIPDWLQERLRQRRLKVVTGPWETDAR